MGRYDAIRQAQYITKWNVLAAVAAVGGTCATISLDQLWLTSWASSGIGFSIGQRHFVELPAGPGLVYYESPVAAPIDDVRLDLLDSNGERLPISRPDKDINYRLLFSGWSGRALWNVNIPATGVYRVACFNHNFEYDTDMPPEDRIVFLKQPNSLDDVRVVRTFIQVTGGTATGTAVLLLYALHGLALQRRKLLAKQQEFLATAK